jgi:hypothetical protein
MVSLSLVSTEVSWNLLALPTKAKDSVFTFIIEYRSLWDFGP